MSEITGDPWGRVTPAALWTGRRCDSPKASCAPLTPDVTTRHAIATWHIRTHPAKPRAGSSPGRPSGPAQPRVRILYLCRQRIRTRRGTGTGVTALPPGQAQALAYRLPARLSDARGRMVQLRYRAPRTSVGACLRSIEGDLFKSWLRMQRLPVRVAPLPPAHGTRCHLVCCPHRLRRRDTVLPTDGLTVRPCADGQRDVVARHDAPDGEFVPVVCTPPEPTG